MEVGINKDKPTIEVNHADLERVSDNSMYGSICPVCPKGILLVIRGIDGTLQEYDYCIWCAQRYKYLDLEKMK